MPTAKSGGRGEDRALPFLRSRRSKFRIWPPSFGSSIPPAIDYAFRGADPARIREDASGFKNSVIGPQIRSQPGQGPNTGRLNARSVDYLPSCQRHDHSRFRFSLNRFVVMRTVKERAAAARVSGLQESICDRPCRNGHAIRRADAKGTCIVCNYLRTSARITRSTFSATNITAERTWREV